MNLLLTSSLGERYKSGCQKARVITEAWGEQNLFCPSCDVDRVTAAPVNTQAIDYVCSGCNATFQLKSQSVKIRDSIRDAGFFAMMKAIREDRTPNLFVLEYDRRNWSVKNLLLVPRFAFTPSAIFRRPPLAPTARRAGWVGCNIILKNIPNVAKIPVVRDCVVEAKQLVRERYRSVLPLSDLSGATRGWTLDVLRMIQAMGNAEFTTNDAYGFERELTRFYPGNHHVRAKIRQQLQVLRDKGFLASVERGVWRMVR